MPAICLPGLLFLGAGIAPGAVTIGPGPLLGTDSGGNAFYQEFQDWTHDDCLALDGVGAAVGGRYNIGDGFDDSRDLAAFYYREEGTSLFFRVDFYDLALGAENGNVDLYVAISCAPGGAVYLPDFTDVQVDPSFPWEVCVCLYDSVNHNVVDATYTNSIGGFLGAYYHSELDAVEFGISRQTLIDAGWNGTDTLHFTVMTTRDNTDLTGGFGDTSDATDTFFDDDRGFDDGVINGVIASDDSVGRAKYASIAHGNQSVNRAGRPAASTSTTLPSRTKTGFLRTLDTHEIFNVPLNIHMSGTLMIAAQLGQGGPDRRPVDGRAGLPGPGARRSWTRTRTTAGRVR